MNPTLIAIIMVAVIIASSFFKRLPSPFVLCIVPVICGLALGFSITDLSEMILKQVNTSMQSAGYMILFAMIYFTMLGETGMFDTLIRGLLKLSHGKLHIYLVMIITTLIAAVGMLTATVATAYLIVFPIMLPIYKKMKFDHNAAMIIAQTAIAGMCFVPWGIAVVNSSVFAGVDPLELSSRLIPVSICFIPAIVLQWIYFGYMHKKQGGLMVIDWSSDEGGESKENELARPRLFWFNLLLFVAVIVVLVKSIMPSYLVFVLAAALTILVDYPSGKVHQKLIAKAGGRFFGTVQMLIGISFFIGIFQGTGMVESLANSIVTNVPEFLTRYIHIILAATMVIVIRFIPNKIYNSMYPVLISIGSRFGLAGTDVIAPFVCNMSLATGSSPFTATTHIGTGLLELDVNRYCNRSAAVQTVTNIVIIATAILVGVVK